MGPGGCYSCISICLPLTTLLARPARIPKHLQLLGDVAPLVDLEALVEALQGSVFLLRPGPPFCIFIIKHVPIDNHHFDNILC